MKTVLINNTIPSLDLNVACIGYFDGIHLGHRQLINKTIQLAKSKSIKSSLITFNPDPLDLISHNKNKHIYSRDYSKRIIEELGFDYYIIIKFDEKIMNTSHLDFLNNYLELLNIDTLVCGYDFTFGYKGLGNYKFLKDNSSFNVVKINQYKYYNKKVSSSRIKQAIYKGNFKLSSKLLDSDYKIILECLNCSKNKNKYLIQAKSYYEDIIIPKDNKYSNFYIKDSIFYILSNNTLNKGDIFEFIP